jgi:IMP dehydrogenase/GMP reductase
MGCSGASAVVFHGVALSVKLGVGLSAGSPAVTVGIAATALNPVGAAWMAGIFVVSAGTLVYGALKSRG